MLDKKLKFPKYGKRLMFATALFAWANYCYQLVNAIKIGRKEGFGSGDIILSSLGYFIQSALMSWTHFLCVLFIIAWINNFTEKANQVTDETFVNHGKIAHFLKNFESLQKGLGKRKHIFYYI